MMSNLRCLFALELHTHIFWGQDREEKKNLSKFKLNNNTIYSIQTGIKFQKFKLIFKVWIIKLFIWIERNPVSNWQNLLVIAGHKG